MGIVWSCTATLLLCSWSIHFWRATCLLWKKTKWMMIALFTPETVLAKAVTDMLSARYNTKMLADEFAKSDGVEWTETHSFFADMGGFAIKFDLDPVVGGPPAPQTCEAKTRQATSQREKHDQCITDRGPREPLLGKGNSDTASGILEDAARPSGVEPRAVHALETSTWVLTAAQLYVARQRGLIRLLPRISEHEMLEKSKGNWLVKVLASLQICWLILQLAVRAYSGKPSSPLEIMTVAFAASSVITYLFLLHHPRDAEIRVYVPAARAASVGDMTAVAQKYPSWWLPLYSPPDSIPNQCINCAPRGWFDKLRATRAWVGFFVIGNVVFGGLHLLAWDSSFPTPTERMLWRVATFVTIFVLVGAALLDYARWSFPRSKGVKRLRDWKLRVYSIFYDPLLALCSITIVLARLFLFLEAYRSLYYLPREVYSGT
ncbi:hypothetical protein B0T24DRAFT_668444 [Lasiosphaeria ovina]|uniref:Uncharacterized protein n=1 Tax=Lasiosphaeria ovina TaxID=92902 RepID=A0AAE0K2I1_9PEZI|nr:hypothetical protein B0T24DRAFT_668444 [Lasiosphaeria ovina]